MQDWDDDALLREYVDRDSGEAFAVLVARYVNTVYSVALRHTANPGQAEEITQAVFVILARKARGLGKRVILSGWLYQTARLTALTSIRGEIRRARREQEAYMQSLLEKTSSDVWSQIAPQLDAAMARLSETDRHAVVLRYFDGKSMKEVGAALGASEDAAKVRLGRAVEKLRLYFHKRGVIHSAGVLTAAISTHAVQMAPGTLAKAATVAALAQGGAVGGSTLTLTHGALKVMAWTKTKSTVLAAAIAILMAGTAVIAVRSIYIAHRNGLHNIVGTWEGTMFLGASGVKKGEATTTRLVMSFRKTFGGYRATANAIDAGDSLRNLPVDLDYDYPTVRLKVNPRTEFTGKVNASANRITVDGLGTLTRTATPDEAPAALTEDEFAPSTGSDLQGYWKGTLGTGPDALPLNWKIAQLPDGTYRADLDNPMQGALEQPVEVTYRRPDVKLLVATHNGMFQGTINSDNSEIKGSWIQGGQRTPSVFKRGDYAADHAQDALKDYSFRSENDLQGHWKGAWVFPVGKVKINIRYALDIAKLPDGSYIATLANIDELGNSDPKPASDFEYSPPKVRMAWKWADNTRYEGTLTDGKIKGTWFEGGGGFKLDFERHR